MAHRRHQMQPRDRPSKFQQMFPLCLDLGNRDAIVAAWSDGRQLLCESGVPQSQVLDQFTFYTLQIKIRLPAASPLLRGIEGDRRKVPIAQISRIGLTRGIVTSVIKPVDKEGMRLHWELAVLILELKPLPS